MAGHGVGKQPSAAYLAEDEGHTMIAIAILFIILNTLSVAIRFYARRLNKSTLGSDDLVIPFAWLVNVGLCALGITMVHEAGVGRHLAYVLETDPHKIAAWAKSLYALEWLYLPAVALPKISILLLYLQIFLDRPARITTYVLICILLANWIAYLVASSLQCLPFAYQWDKSIPGGKCFNQRAFYKTVSGPNIATDVIILVLPLKTVWGLRTSVMRKVGLLIVFLTGSVGIIASCVRMASFFQTEAFEDNTCESHLCFSSLPPFMCHLFQDKLG
ncbi:hypothetical protein GQ43DRAFT_307710 [Delitschia confertaspora ATCC 74209]|uniref:Rhodopsin domain-containing protein n=1 Tax=Delitschia confertaspora ATCC 74209 TaxID=1513339 RepID=A0A9P4JNX6_9PLEO|nr:hypothetical protein GQ43DRAFT_307710 [Delitschia confertaspora ATCC 74209]